MWFTETPWPPMIILSILAFVFGGMWPRRRQSWWIVGVIVSIVLAIGVYVFEQSIITPREQIAQHIHTMATAFQERDEEELLSFISMRADDVRAKVALGFLTVTDVQSLRITDVEVTMLAQGTRAKLHFRANGSFTVRGYGDVGHQPTRWLMTWQQEGGLWKVIDVERINTMTGEPVGITDPRR